MRSTTWARWVPISAGVAMIAFGVPSLVMGSYGKVALLWGIGLISLIYGFFQRKGETSTGKSERSAS